MTKVITAEIGTSDQYETVVCGDDFRAAIAEAIQLEHKCDDTEGDDIARALDDGYPLVAADDLQGATETPLLDAVIRHYCDAGIITDWRALSDAERDEWLRTDTWTAHAHECPSCGSITFGDDYETPNQCSNCLAPLSPDPDSEE